MLSELRKYRVNLTLVHQYLDQLDQDLYAAVLGNVESLLAFRVAKRTPKFWPESSPRSLQPRTSWGSPITRFT
jgi:hypothetical protein